MNTPLEALDRLKELAKAAIADNDNPNYWAAVKSLNAFNDAANPQAILDLLTSYEAQGERLREVEGALEVAGVQLQLAGGWLRELGHGVAAEEMLRASNIARSALTQPPAMENGE